jgi:hypothetical protein
LACFVDRVFVCDAFSEPERRYEILNRALDAIGAAVGMDAQHPRPESQRQQGYPRVDTVRASA